MYIKMNPKLKQHYALRQKDIENKKYYCVDCDKSFRDKYTLDKHLDGLKHHPERKVMYHCESCDYTTKFKHCLKNHLTTQKHLNKNPI